MKELGAVIYNCSRLAQDLEKTFQTYWVLGAPRAVLPKPWPRNFSSHINRFQPLRDHFDGLPTTAYFSVRVDRPGGPSEPLLSGQPRPQEVPPTPALPCRPRYLQGPGLWSWGDPSRRHGHCNPRETGSLGGRGRPMALEPPRTTLAGV